MECLKLFKDQISSVTKIMVVIEVKEIINHNNNNIPSKSIKMIKNKDFVLKIKNPQFV